MNVIRVFISVREVNVQEFTPITFVFYHSGMMHW